MNLHRPNANEALQTKNRSRDVAPQSGICSRCLDVAARYSNSGNYLAGANIAGFMRVANSMLDQGLV